jgi:hypothetical protein
VNASGARMSWTYGCEASWGPNLVEPASMKMSEEQVMVQGEAARPASVKRLAATSSLYPRKR